MTPAPRAAVPLILALLVVAGAALRMAPVWRDPGLAPLSDAANHARLALLASAPGGLPAVDSLSNAPQGRRLARDLPLGLYRSAAAFHRVLAGLGARDARANLYLFIALGGALIVVPVYLGARARFGDPRAALLAALIATCLPAHLDRTLAHRVRFDAPGITLCALHAAFALRALTAPAGRGRRLEALASAVCLVLAAWMWRVALVLPAIESLFVLGWLAGRGRDEAVRDWWVVTVAVATVGFLGVGYLREQRFVVSASWLLPVAAAALALAMPERAQRSLPARLALVAGVAGLALAAGRWLVPREAYGSILGALLARFRVWLAPGAPLTLAERLRLDVDELSGMSPLRFLIGIKDFFLIGPWCLAAPLLPGRRREPGSGPRPAAWLLAAWVVALALLTLLFVRNKALLAPFFAMVAGGVFVALQRAPGGRGLRLAFLASVVATGALGVLLATSRASRLEPSFAAALEGLRERTPRDATVLALWGSGYEIQAYAGRRTVVDGLLESPENERRILEINAAFLGDDDAALERLCREYGVTHLLVPPREGLFSAAREAGDALADRIQFGVPLAPEDARRTLVELMLGRAPAAFQPVFQSGDWRIYRFAAEGP